MFVISSNAHMRMVEVAKEVKGTTAACYALRFHLSRLQEHYRSEFQMRIAANILNDVFRGEDGYIFICNDGDIFVLYRGGDRKMIEKSIFQMRYLFIDDPLASNEDGSAGEDFSTLYDLTFQWRSFYKLCVERSGDEHGTDKAEMSASTLLTPSRLARVEIELEAVDVSFALRRQAVCAIKRGAKPVELRGLSQHDVRPVFYETYININHLRRLLSVNCDLASNKWLFKHLTEALDEHVLGFVERQRKAYLSGPISLNLNIRTILSDVFARFCDMLREVLRISVVIEVHISDVFADMDGFLAARKIVHQRGHRLCIDGLDNRGFVQVERESLGFDLAKLQWNADIDRDKKSETTLRLEKAVAKCGKERIILCRCDSVHAIDYGHSIGISLFQGRYPDRILEPDAVVIN